MLKAKAKVKEINEARQEEAKQTADKEDESNGPQIVGEATAAMNGVQDLQANCIDEMSLEKRIEMLNPDQMHVFERVSVHLQHQQRHESGDCKCTKMEPLHMFVSGVGGTGKSFLLKPSGLRWLQYGKTSRMHLSVL